VCLCGQGGRESRWRLADDACVDGRAAFRRRAGGGRVGARTMEMEGEWWEDKDIEEEGAGVAAVRARRDGCDTLRE
jgi:hypothetical protein